MTEDGEIEKYYAGIRNKWLNHVKILKTGRVFTVMLLPVEFPPIVLKACYLADFNSFY